VKFVRSVVIAMLLGSVAGFANAGVGFVGQGGLAIGGTEMDLVEREDGQTLSAGGLFYLDAGLVYGFVGFPIDVQTSLGFKGDTMTASNGDASFTRFTSQLLAFYRVGQFRLGGGMSYHFSPEYEDEVDDYSTQRIEYESAAGVLLQGDYAFNDYFMLGARMEVIKYQASKYCLDEQCVDADQIANEGNEKYLEPNGNNFGVHAAVRFGGN
jgi:hypothetical protein